jgi:hypothetical protein
LYEAVVFGFPLPLGERARVRGKEEKAYLLRFTVPREESTSCRRHGSAAARGKGESHGGG